jgi:hypothetical protein
MANDLELPQGYTLDPTFKPGFELPPGFTLDPTFKPQVGTAEDMARGAVSGLAGGAAGIVGGLGDARGLMDQLGDWIGKKIYGDTPEENAKAAKAKAAVHNYSFGLPQLPTTADVKAATGLSALDYEPTSTAGNVAKNVAEFVPGALTGGQRSIGEGIANIARFGLAPGLASEGVGAAADAFPAAAPYKPIVAPIAAMVAGHYAGRAISPNASTLPDASREAYAGHVKTLEDMGGFKLSPAERSGSKELRIAEEETNPERYVENREAVTRQATKSISPEFEAPVLKQANPDTGAPSTLERIQKAVGKRFDDAIKPNVLDTDAKLGADLMGLHNEYVTAAGYDRDAVDALDHASNRVRETLMANGPSPRTGLTFMSGPEYQRIRSSVNKLAMNSEGQKADALHDFVRVLDDSFDRSVSRTNPADLGKVQDARRQWKGFLTLEKAAGRSDVDHVTPAAIESAAQSVYGKRAQLQGKTDFAWAPSAKAVLKTEANSNTAIRTEMRNKLEKRLARLGGIGGYLLGAHFGGPESASAFGGAVGGLLGTEQILPLVAGPLKKMQHAWEATPPGRWQQGNQLLAGAPGMVSLPGLLSAARAGSQ